MPKVPKIRSLYIFAISPERLGDEVDFLLVDKRKSFLQVNSITLGVHSQACPKYPKQQGHSMPNEPKFGKVPW